MDLSSATYVNDPVVRSLIQEPVHATYPGYRPQAQPASQAEDLSQRLQLVQVVDWATGASIGSDAPSGAPLTGLASAHTHLQQHSSNPTCSVYSLSDVEYVRLEKRRARNRASQRRSRQKHRVRSPALLFSYRLRAEIHWIERRQSFQHIQFRPSTYSPCSSQLVVWRSWHWCCAAAGLANPRSSHIADTLCTARLTL